MPRLYLLFTQLLCSLFLQLALKQNSPHNNSSLLWLGPRATPARIDVMTMALDIHVDHPDPSIPPLRDRCSPRCRHESMGSEEVSGDVSRSSLHGGGHPTRGDNRVLESLVTTEVIEPMGGH